MELKIKAKIDGKKYDVKAIDFDDGIVVAIIDDKAVEFKLQDVQIVRYLGSDINENDVYEDDYVGVGHIQNSVTNGCFKSEIVVEIKGKIRMDEDIYIEFGKGDTIGRYSVNRDCFIKLLD